MKADGHSNFLGMIGGFLLYPLFPFTLPTPMPGIEDCEHLPVSDAFHPQVHHLSLTGGGCSPPMKSRFLISMGVPLEAFPAVQGELNVRRVWRMIGGSIFLANTFGFSQLLHLCLGCSRTCRTPWSQWPPRKFGEYCEESKHVSVGWEPAISASVHSHLFLPIRTEL